MSTWYLEPLKNLAHITTPVAVRSMDGNAAITVVEQLLSKQNTCKPAMPYVITTV